jgi:hypothetical protein
MNGNDDGCAFTTITGVMAVLLVAAVLFLNGFYVQGQAAVSEVAWRRVLHIEMFMPVAKDTLIDEMPADAYNIAPYDKRITHTSTFRCGKVTCTHHWDTTESRATYTHNEWVLDHDLVTSGSRNDQPQWFPFIPFTDQELYAEHIASKDELLTVKFTSGSDTYTYNAPDADTWLKYSVGRTYTLWVNLQHQPKWDSLQIQDKR